MDGSYRYWINDRMCTGGFHIPVNHTRKVKYLTNVLTAAVFAILPLALTINFYVKLSGPLLKRKTKVGRNFNLVMAFGSSCAIYANSQFWHLVHDSYNSYLYEFVPPHQLYKHPLHFNNGAHPLRRFIVASTLSCNSLFFKVIANQ